MSVDMFPYDLGSLGIKYKSLKYLIDLSWGDFSRSDIMLDRTLMKMVNDL